MTAPDPKADPKPAPKMGTALMAAASTFDERALAYQLTDRIRRQEMLAQASAKLAETSWGMKLSPVARMGVARYAMETGTDPVRHWEVLGGRLYDKAELYLDLCASRPDYLKNDVEYIHDDERLTPEEREQRKRARARHGAPEEAKGIAVVTLFFKGRGPFVGVNWAGRGRKTKDGGWQDPVGEENPTKTAYTRAFRRAAKQAVPLWFLSHPWAERAEQFIAQGEAVSRAADEAVRQTPRANWVDRLAEMNEGYDMEPLGSIPPPELDSGEGDK